MSNVLFVFSHCDDEILVAGGTLAKHVSDGDQVHGLILSPGVGSRDGSRDGIPARVAMCLAASDVIGYDVEILDWPDQMFDTRPQLELNRAIEFHLGVHNFKPDIVYTHWDQDNNLDHRLVSQACMVACRSVGEICMGKPNGEWIGSIALNPNPFLRSAASCRDVSDFLDKKQAALDCYRDELGEMKADKFESFIIKRWHP